MAQKTSPVTLIIRIALIVILVVLVGAFVIERRAAAAAKSAYDHAKEVVQSKKDGATLEQLVGRKPDFDEAANGVREQRFTFKGVIRNYTVNTKFSVQDKGEVGEEADLTVFDKLKGRAEPSEDAPAFK